jgi:putative ABC transport system permease protein
MVFKGTFRHAPRGVTLRKGLVVFQFTASIALIAGTFAVYRQLDYMMNHDLGFDGEGMVIVEQPGRLEQAPTARRERIETFKQTAAAIPQVQTVAASSIVPGRGIHRGIVLSRTFHADVQDTQSIEPVLIDDAFLDAYGFTFVAGRNFSRELASDADAIILNASAARALGFEIPAAALAQKLYEYGAEERTVIGVIADYHHESLHRNRDPMYFTLHPYVDTYYSIKLSARSAAAGLEGVRAAYQAAFPGNPFEYFFLDATFAQQYRADRQFSGMFRLFAGLAILVACLGLYGLVAFTTLQRRKEIGVRKVLGATPFGILVLIARDFARLVLLATLVAVPLAYLGLDRWLTRYAFQMALSWWLFAVPVGLVALLTVLTVGTQALKAAQVNPVDSLRTE